MWIPDTLILKEKNFCFFTDNQYFIHCLCSTSQSKFSRHKSPVLNTVNSKVNFFESYEFSYHTRNTNTVKRIKFESRPEISIYQIKKVVEKRVESGGWKWYGRLRADREDKDVRKGYTYIVIWPRLDIWRGDVLKERWKGNGQRLKREGLRATQAEEAGG
jgi:hypothetical protein